MKKLVCILLCFALCICTAIPVYAGDSIALNISKNSTSHSISKTLFGVTLDDVSFGIEGGLASNMVNNNSFEYSKNPEYAWNISGVSTVISNQSPISKNNPTYETVTVDGSGVITNIGYPQLLDSSGSYDKEKAKKPSMSFNKNIYYIFSCYIMNVDYNGKISVFLDSKSNSGNGVNLSLNGVNKNGWTRVTTKIKSNSTELGGLGIKLKGEGSICLDYITLVPENSYGIGDGGWKYVSLRRDMVDAIKELKPAFLKFPGDCIAEGNGGFCWKDTIGAPVERKQCSSVWDDSSKGVFYNNSNLMGYHEYFQLARDLSATPVAVVGAGIGCQTNGEYEAYCQARNKTYMNDEQWEAYLTEECGYKKSEVKARTEYIDSLGIKSIEDFDEYVSGIAYEPGTDEFTNYAQDILDLIEYANGDSNSSYWASLRAQNGSEQPFDLKYIQIGGDNYGEVYWRNFDALYSIIKEKYPKIKIIASTGYSSNGEEFDTAWSRLGAKYSKDYANEKFVGDKIYPLSQYTTRYDSYARDGAKVVLDEYRSLSYARDSAIENSNVFSCSQEASFITGLERNSDVVAMASSSPIFSKIGGSTREQSLVWYDNDRLIFTPSYYMQMIFANNVGDTYLDASFNVSSDALFQSATIDEGSQTLYVKLVNTGSAKENISVNLSDFDEIHQASMLSLGSSYKSAYNSTKRQTIAPASKELELNDNGFDVELEPYSVSVVRVAYGTNVGKGFYSLPDDIDLNTKGYTPMSVKLLIVIMVGLFIISSAAGYFAYTRLVLKDKRFKPVKKNKKEKKEDEE